MVLTSSRMRVLLICHAYGTPVFQHKVQLLDQYPDVEMGLVVPRRWGEVLHQGEYRVLPGATFRVFPVRVYHAKNITSFFYHPAELATAVLRLRPHILHVEEEPWSLALFQTSLLKTLAPWHKLLFFTWENIAKVYPRPYRWFEQYALRVADTAIAGNQEAAEIIRHKGYRRPIHVLPQMGVDPDLFQPLPPADPAVARLRQELRLEGFVVGYVGRLEKGKGLHTLFRALARWQVPWTLVLVGAGPLRQELPNYAAYLGIAERIRWVGRVPPEVLPAYYRLIDVLVLPSDTHKGWKEQFGRVLIEAMACQVPVIGSSSGAIPEVIGEAGLIFPERDHQALAEALEHLRANPALRANLAQQGRNRVLKHFTNQVIAARTYEIYRSLVKQG
jgi:glycosyltransferase involved in cell wall biosynthesis